MDDFLQCRRQSVWTAPSAKSLPEAELKAQAAFLLLQLLEGRNPWEEQDYPGLSPEQLRQLGAPWESLIAQDSKYPKLDWQASQLLPDIYQEMRRMQAAQSSLQDPLWQTACQQARLDVAMQAWTDRWFNGYSSLTRQWAGQLLGLLLRSLAQSKARQGHLPAPDYWLSRNLVQQMGLGSQALPLQWNLAYAAQDAAQVPELLPLLQTQGQRLHQWMQHRCKFLRMPPDRAHFRFELLQALEGRTSPPVIWQQKMMRLRQHEAELLLERKAKLPPAPPLRLLARWLDYQYVYKPALARQAWDWLRQLLPQTPPEKLIETAVQNEALRLRHLLRTRMDAPGPNFLARQLLPHLPPAQRQRKDLAQHKVRIVCLWKSGSDRPPASWMLNTHYILDNLDIHEFVWNPPETPDITWIICTPLPLQLDVLQALFQTFPHPQALPEFVEACELSALHYQELRKSALRPPTMCRSFYTSYSAKEILTCLGGRQEILTAEHWVEAKYPALIIPYHRDNYCRLKPGETVRVKYRSPVGSNSYIPWEATRWIRKLTREQCREHWKNLQVSLILVEGEKKGAMLAQMAWETGQPLHVIALPGVWMGIQKIKKFQLIPEITRFNLQGRTVYIIFDNDMLLNGHVLHACLETCRCLLDQGAEPRLVHIPFGPAKGIDDFAWASCRQEQGLDYGPILKLLETSLPVTRESRAMQVPDLMVQGKKLYDNRAAEAIWMQQCARWLGYSEQAWNALHQHVQVPALYNIMASQLEKRLQQFVQEHRDYLHTVQPNLRLAEKANTV